MNPVATLRRRRTLLKSQWLDEDAIRALQTAKLRRIVDYAYSHVAHYRRLFDSVGFQPRHISSIRDLRHVPITTKQELQRLPPEDRIGNDLDLRTLVQERTSGSTGEPFTSYFDRSFVTTRNGLFLRALHVAGYRPGQKLMLVTADTGRSRPYLRWRYASIESSAEELVSQLDSFRPSVLYGCTTPLRMMAEFARESGRSFHRPGVVVCTAETLDATTRTLLRDVFNADVFDIYGLTETGLIAWECGAHDGYHLSEDTAIVELHEDPEHDAEQLIVTNLALKSMPMIRFQTGDLATMVMERDCQCGRTLRRIRHIAGRMVDCLKPKNNRVVTPYEVTLAMEAVPGLDRYQVVQTDADRFVVRIETRHSSQSDLEPDVRRALSPLLGDDSRLSIALEASIAPPPGKKFRVVANSNHGKS